MSEENAKPCQRNRLDVFLTVLALLTMIPHMGWLSYLDARWNWGIFYVDYVLVLACSTLLIPPVCLFVLGIRLAVAKSNKIPARTKTVCFSSVLVCGLLVWLFFVPLYRWSARGFRDRVIHEVDIVKLREWHMKENGKGKHSDHIEEIPAFLKTMKPSYIVIIDIDGEINAINIVCGGGHEHFGIMVGPETMDTPESSKNNYVYELSPGIYVYYGE